MEKIVINGRRPLAGEVGISGAKNAALAIIPSTILTEDICRIENVPNIRDVRIMVQIIEEIGVKVRYINKNTLEIDARNIIFKTIPDALAKRLRASYYLIGAMLGRFNRASVAMPGGCFFGTRPIDQHIKGFEALGTRVRTDGAVIDARTDSLKGSEIYFDVVSVGATVNVMLAAVKAEGLTIIENAAKEPHVVDLANCLNFMGADIRGAGTDIIKIRGVKKLNGCTYSIIPDQIEAGTYMVAAAATGGDVLIKNVTPKHLDSISAKLVECGAIIEENDDSIRVIGTNRPMKCNIKTMPHPGFPTDMQPQMATYLTIAEGTSIISESVWDNRFRYVDQLVRMGASIQVEGKAAIISGITELRGAPVRADDLRAGAAMIIAGLIARGETEIEDIHHIDRGYEDIVDKLRSLGASIERRTFPDPVMDSLPAVAVAAV